MTVYMHYTNAIKAIAKIRKKDERAANYLCSQIYCDIKDAHRCGFLTEFQRDLLLAEVDKT